MAKCSRCGKRGLFLKLDSNQLCDTCVEAWIERVKSKGRSGVATSREIIQTAGKIFEICPVGEFADKTKEILAKSSEISKMLDKEFQSQTGNHARLESIVDRENVKINELKEQASALLSRVEAEEREKAEERLRGEHNKGFHSSPAAFAPEMFGVGLAYKYENVDVYIVDGQEPDFELLSCYSTIGFVPEPDNAYDPGAVRVETMGTGGQKLGYLYRGTIQDMVRDYISRGDYISSDITLVDASNKKIQIALGFYKNKANESPEYDKSKTYKLTGNTNEEMQDNIDCCNVGDEVDVEYDYEKEKYLVSSGFELGYLPKSVETMLDGDYAAIVDEIGRNDNGKLFVRVTIYYNG